MKSLFTTLLLLLSPVAWVSVVHGQSYSIDWAAITGGGGSSTGPVYSVSGTIGQPIASGALMSGGDYSVTGGFWALTVVQTESAPRLSIALTITNAVIISWPLSTTNWMLQQSADLSGASWITSSATVNTNGLVKFIIITPPAGNRFYRLFRSQ